jgi:hypothetical protein
MPSSRVSSRPAVDQIHIAAMSWFPTGAAGGVIPPTITCRLPVQRLANEAAKQGGLPARGQGSQV